MKTMYRISLIIVIIMSIYPLVIALAHAGTGAYGWGGSYLYVSPIVMGNLTSYITYCYREKNLLKLSTLVYIAINVLMLIYVIFFTIVAGRF